MHSTVLI